MSHGAVPLTALLDNAPRFLFFTGKGGVGKTSLSCATALALARRGRRVLLISTDPASNLSEVLGVTLGSAPRTVPEAGGLSAMNIDPEEAARAYREKVVAPYRTSLPAAMVAGIEEQLSGACTTEIAAFNEFSRFLGDPDATRGYEHTVFDTAPTGHTLRLLQLPAAWQHFISTNTSGASCLGPLSGLSEHKDLYERTLAALCNPATTQLILVSRPERAALSEAERSRDELAGLGLRNLHLVLNGVMDEGSDDAVAAAMAARQRAALRAMPAGIAALPRSTVHLKSFNLNGINTLDALFDATTGGHDAAPPPGSEGGDPAAEPLGTLIDDLARSGSGVIMTMGKGGVGKTTLAAAIALELAARGHRVLLTTTDPAAHLKQTLDGVAEHLEVGRIDPGAVTRAYAEDVLATAGAGLDAEDRRLLDEDLRSPCTEEIAVFRAFADLVEQAQDRFVVLDTAPTGHTLLLLDATESYHREVLRNQSAMPEPVKRLLPRLRDPSYTRVLIVTLPEFTPVHEATMLQADLRRAGIEPYAWVVNQSLQPLSVTHPLLAARRAHERPHLAEVRRQSVRRCIVPWLSREPVGIDGLRPITQPDTEVSPTP
ncbi:MAG TPA: arsenical pump-driving ATPase [Kiritimatiellia bacterium]|nr:arsenical pump-driving ATPase [Kiritimatiellia bacterium]HMP34021.1 arsenical pump-driving ATPase [Kiritimatiellia bacterium]